MKLWIFLALLVGSTFATVCPNQSVAVCGINNQNYANESMATANGTLIIYCGTCSAYQYFQASQYVYNTSNTSGSQLNTSSRSYLERFLSSSMGRLVGDQAQGSNVLAVAVGAFFFVFMLFQNTRIEAKIAVLVPAGFLMAYFMGWMIILYVLLVGIILFIGLSRLFNR